MDTTDINFQAPPFTGFDGFTNEELELILKYLYSNNSKLTDEIKVEKHNQTDNGTRIMASKNGNFTEMEILYKEANLFKDDSLLTKIYSVEQLDAIISKVDMDCKYDIKIYDDKPYENIKTEKSKVINIEIRYKTSLEAYNFKNYIKREENDIFKENAIEEKVVELEKLRLSPYFNNIIKDPQNNNNFKLIINEDRFRLIKKIIDFWESKNLFYVIMGADGIGKTTTMLFFSYYLHIYNVFYLNLKLFSGKTKKEAEDIFFNEIKRIFFVSKTFSSEFTLDGKYQRFKKLKLSILKEAENNSKNINTNGIDFMWLLLQTFLNKLIQSEILKTNTLIILDQYKCDNIDEKYQNLNQTCLLIEKINSRLSYYKYKLLIIVSINNYDTKKMFLENLNITYFDNNNNKSISKKIDKNDKKDDNIDSNSFEENRNYELLNIQKFLDSKIDKINKSFNESISKLEYNSKSDSLCLLNTRFFLITRKEYLNFNTYCKKLIPSNIGKNYLHCIKAFNYSVKYFQLLMGVISENPKKDCENKDEYEKRMSKLFYTKMFNRIRDNIDKSYKNMLPNHSSSELVNLSMKYLISLRNYIYEEQTFLINDIEILLNRFPVKYLNVFLSSFEELDNNIIQFGFYNFFFTYSNIFIKHAINEIINGYLRTKSYNDFDGINFEKIVNENILKIIFHNQKLIKRNIFSLVGITESTKNYVNKLREKENSEFYEFYGLKRLQNILIDGIDEIKIKRSTLDITSNDIFLNQVSKNGRSFDAGLLIKKDHITNSGTNDLVLFQDTINKIIDIKKKEIYIQDSINSKNYLESVYEGLKIDKIYFIFIIPEHYQNIDKTVGKLNLYQIYYLYYSLEKKVFLDWQNNIISDFRIKEADITFPEKNFYLIKAISDINLSKYIIKESSKKYLIKKKNTNKTFNDIYNKICEINLYECIKVFIPVKLKENIIKMFISEKYIEDKDIINFIPSANYIGTEIENIFKNTNNMIIFSYNDNIYLFYYSYFQINEHFEIQKINKLCINSLNISNGVKSPKKNLDEFKKIKKYPLFYFCFNIIKNYDFEEFYTKND